MILGGYSVLGDSVIFPGKSENFEEICNELNNYALEISRKNSIHLYFDDWVNYFKGRCDELEHVGFPVLWLSSYVFQVIEGNINPHVYAIAICLAQGTNLTCHCGQPLLFSSRTCNTVIEIDSSSGDEVNQKESQTCKSTIAQQSEREKRWIRRRMRKVEEQSKCGSVNELASTVCKKRKRSLRGGKKLLEFRDDQFKESESEDIIRRLDPLCYTSRGLDIAKTSREQCLDRSSEDSRNFEQTNVVTNEEKEVSDSDLNLNEGSKHPESPSSQQKISSEDNIVEPLVAPEMYVSSYEILAELPLGTEIGMLSCEVAESEQPKAGVDQGEQDSEISNVPRSLAVCEKAVESYSFDSVNDKTNGISVLCTSAMIPPRIGLERATEISENNVTQQDSEHVNGNVKLDDDSKCLEVVKPKNGSSTDMNKLQCTLAEAVLAKAGSQGTERAAGSGTDCLVGTEIGVLSTVPRSLAICEKAAVSYCSEIFNDMINGNHLLCARISSGLPGVAVSPMAGLERATEISENYATKQETEDVHVNACSVKLSEDSKHLEIVQPEIRPSTDMTGLQCTLTEAELAKAASQGTNMDHLNSSAGAGNKNIKIVVIDQIVISDGEDDAEVNPFGALFLEFESMISRLENEVSTMTAANFSASVA